VISSVGNILLSYDSDGAVPTFGFGAKLSGSCNDLACIISLIYLQMHVQHKRKYRIIEEAKVT
jgi:hypothetical protein